LPERLTAGTVSAIIAITSPHPRNANATTVNASARSSGLRPRIPIIIASTSCSTQALTRRTYRDAIASSRPSDRISR
jgi:hypothetical protein